MLPSSPNFMDIDNITYDLVLKWLQCYSSPEKEILKETVRLSLVQKHLEESSETNPTILRQVVKRILDEHLEILATKNSEATEILRLRFVENKTDKAVGFELDISRDAVQRKQKIAIEYLANIIKQTEHHLRTRQIHSIMQPLGTAPYTQLFGVEEICNQLAHHLIHGEPPWNIAITGIGGIGKTSVADKVIRLAISQSSRYQRVEKIVVKNELASEQHLIDALVEKLLPDISQNAKEAQLRQLLKTIPHLIFIDNIEIDISHLFGVLDSLSVPSKFVLTVREQPSVKNRIFVWSLKPLSFKDATDLIRFYANYDKASQKLTEASNKELEQIYEKVGGNPLALKLIIGLTTSLSVANILTDLTEVQHQETEKMYLHIYQKAWSVLDADSQQVLLIMPIISSDGDTLEAICTIIQGGNPSWTKRNTINALTNLVTRSLVSATGSVWDSSYLYSIHNLTRSFLTTDIIDWPRDSV